MKTWCSAVLASALSLGLVTTEAKLPVARNGKARVVVYTQAGATAPELWAAQELTNVLHQITGATFELRQAGAKVPAKSILVGPGPAASALFPDLALDQLGHEEMVIRTKGKVLLLAGGRTRGTLYAVSRFLQDQCGVRWWTPWATTVPHNADLVIPDLKIQGKPAFEARDPFWYPAFNAEWAVRNRSNSQNAHLSDALGGAVQYKGFVHTFYSLVPPEKHFTAHPEWFSLVDGKRTADHAQLCLTNPQLRDFVVERVKEWLRETPGAAIVSVSQNDWHKPCKCPNCKAIDDAEGGPSGSLLQFVNYVAEKIAPEFPQVAVDTLAYQYTRQAPKTIQPRPNVIVRLCSIECNFGAPLDDPSNRDFARDIEAWSKICRRLYVWDYVTDFAHYVQPHPNWYSLGPNVRFFHEHNVVGLFEQGAYQSSGGEMSELRAWVLAQLMWTPALDDRLLIKEFLHGYYGPGAARFIQEYFDLLYKASRDYKLTCYSPTDAPFLKFGTLAEAERLWQQAEAAAARDPEKSWRVRIAHLPLRYVWLARWVPLRAECQKASQKWPLDASRKAVADEWMALATGPGPKGWTKMTHLSEGGLTPATFIARFAVDPPAP